MSNKVSRTWTLDREVVNKILSNSKQAGLSAPSYLNSLLRAVFDLQSAESRVKATLEAPDKQVVERVGREPITKLFK